MDERYAVIDVAGKGLVIFSAYVLFGCIVNQVIRSSNIVSCSHAGIVNVVKDAVAKFAKPIYMVNSLYYHSLESQHINNRLSAVCILAGQNSPREYRPRWTFFPDSSDLHPHIFYLCIALVSTPKLHWRRLSERVVCRQGSA